MDESSTLIERLELTEPDVSVEIGGVNVTAGSVVEAIRTGVLVPDKLPARELTVVLQLVEIARRRTEALLTGVCQVADRKGAYARDGHRAMRGLLKASLRWSNHQTRVQADISQLVADHDLCRDEYLAGRLGLAQAAVLARLACHPRAGVHFGGSEDLLVRAAKSMEYEDFRKICDRWMMFADLDGADQDEALRHYTRNGCCIRGADGMIHLDARFAGAQGRIVKEIFDRFYDAETEADWDAARAEHGTLACKGDLPRSDEQRRADAVAAIFQRAASADPEAKSPVPVVEIIVDQDTAETLLARAMGADYTPPDPNTFRTRRCEYADGEPAAPADVAAAIVIGELRRVIIDSAGVVIDLGRRSRLFTGSARTAAQLQYWRCTHPGCVSHGIPDRRLAAAPNSRRSTRLRTRAPFRTQASYAKPVRDGVGASADPTSTTHSRPDGTEIKPV